MTDILLISWYLAGIFVILGAITGFIIFIKELKNLTRDHSTKMSLIYMAITSISVIIEIILICIMGIFHFGIDSKLWFPYSFLYVIVASSWFFGTYNLLKIVQEIGGK